MAARRLSFAVVIVLVLALLVSSAGTTRIAVAQQTAATPINFTGEELLGKPTDSSITINIVPATTIEYHY